MFGRGKKAVVEGDNTIITDRISGGKKETNVSQMPPSEDRPAPVQGNKECFDNTVGVDKRKLDDTHPSLPQPKDEEPSPRLPLKADTAVAQPASQLDKSAKANEGGFVNLLKRSTRGGTRSKGLGLWKGQRW